MNERFLEWLEKGSRARSNLQDRFRVAVARLVKQFYHLGCITGDGKSTSGLQWQPERVRQWLNKYDLHLQKDNNAHVGNMFAKRLQLDHGAPIEVIDTLDQLNRAQQKLSATSSYNTTNDGSENGKGLAEKVVAVDCEGVPNNLYLIQIGTGKITYIFDCVELDPKIVCQALSALFADSRIIKLFHDLHSDAFALANFGGLSRPLQGTLDTQLAMECLTGELHMGFNKMLEHLGCQPHKTKQARHQHDRGGYYHSFSHRPLSMDMLQYAADDVDLLIKAKYSLFGALKKDRGEPWNSVRAASDTRAAMAVRDKQARQLGFDLANSHASMSRELLAALRPDAVQAPIPLTVSNDVSVLIDLLPKDITDVLSDATIQRQLSEIVLDKGRRPWVWAAGTRIFLGSDDREVDESDIQSIVDKFGSFGSDNRAGLERHLHYISAVRNRQQEIIGITVHVGRHHSGRAAMISDLLFGDPTKSILFLGERGSGKVRSLFAYGSFLSCLCYDAS
jgi:hypothetical protein